MRIVYAQQIADGSEFLGGVQPGLYRLDAGPRVSMKVRDNVRVHLDWRQRIVGNSLPGSGPAVTLAANFYSESMGTGSLARAAICG